MKTAVTGIYEATPATLSEGAQGQVHLDANQNLKVASSAMTSAESLANSRSTATLKTPIASGTSSVTILASNANRKGATIYNSDANILYLDLSGGTASSTSFSVAVAANGYYEVPFGSTSLITGIWAADGSGSAYVTEFA